MTDEYQVRLATVADLSTIIHQRTAMFADMQEADATRLAEIAAASRPWLERKLVAGDYLTWFAVSREGFIAAGAGLWLIEWPPTSTDVSCRRGMILNVYTELAHRKRGLARQLTETALEWCRQHGSTTVILHASQEGRPLYASLGFEPTSEMKLVREPAIQ